MSGAIKGSQKSGLLIYLSQLLAGLLIILLSACGNGNGGGTSNQDGNTGFIAIEQPTTGPTYTTDKDMITLSGGAFANIEYFHCCPAHPGVTVTWSNLNTGDSGVAVSQVTYFFILIVHTWSASIPLVMGENHINMTASDPAGNFAEDSITITYDPTLPSVTIQQPSDLSTYATNTIPVALQGKTIDDIGVTEVRWLNDATGDSGLAAGTDIWEALINIVPGDNPIKVTVMDVSGKTAYDTILIILDINEPLVTIAAPTIEPEFTTNSNFIILRGTASDNRGVERVVWFNETTGAAGDTSGTESWSASVPLDYGTNLIIITAEDEAGNISTDEIMVTFDGLPDSIRPTIMITSPPLSVSDTSLSQIEIIGTATDDTGVLSVICENTTIGLSGGQTDYAMPTTFSWSCLVLLALGENHIMITACDGAGNSSTEWIVIIRSP